jgi:hypothetical protein
MPLPDISIEFYRTKNRGMADAYRIESVQRPRQPRTLNVVGAAKRSRGVGPRRYEREADHG